MHELWISVKVKNDAGNLTYYTLLYMTVLVKHKDAIWVYFLEELQTKNCCFHIWFFPDNSMLDWDRRHRLRKNTLVLLTLHLIETNTNLSKNMGSFEKKNNEKTALGIR